jgi:hypothetical protein
VPDEKKILEVLGLMVPITLPCRPDFRRMFALGTKEFTAHGRTPRRFRYRQQIGRHNAYSDSPMSGADGRT